MTGSHDPAYCELAVCDRCDSYGDGYAAGKDAAYFAISTWKLGAHASDCGCMQVDCIKDRLAHEIKLRVTIAASGQGRWQEELDFPQDAVESGFRPILIVLDPTPNPKLTDLSNAFAGAGGVVYTGEEAWAHLEEEAGGTMAKFLETYVRSPLDDLLNSAPVDLPDLTLSMQADAVLFNIGTVEYSVPREPTADPEADQSRLWPA